MNEPIPIMGRRVRADALVAGAMGRDHHPYGFTMWMADGGVAGGRVLAATEILGAGDRDARGYA